MLPDSSTAAPRTDRRLVKAAGAAMVALWLVWAATAWWSEPRPASVEQLRGDLAAGHVVSYGRAEGWDQRRLWPAPIGARYGPHGQMLIWATSNGRIFYATPDSGDIAETVLLTRQLDEAGIGYGTQSPVSKVAMVAMVAMVAALVLVLAGLGVLIGGPDPARGTRWFWFWVGQVPLGLGYLAWLLCERPWTEPRRRLKRETGWAGLAIMIVGAMVLSALTLAANRLLGWWLVPA